MHSRGISFRWALALVVFVSLVETASSQQASPGTGEGGWHVGDAYQVNVERHGIRERYSGNLVKVTPRWIVLHTVSNRRTSVAKSAWSDAPLLGPLFRRTRNEVVDEFVWVPRPAASVDKHEPAEQPQTPAAPPGDDPPVHVTCNVQLAGRTKVGFRAGGLQSIDDKQLTLAVPREVPVEEPTNVFDSLKSRALGRGVSSESTVSMQSLPMRDVLCVRVANFEMPAGRPKDF